MMFHYFGFHYVTYPQPLDVLCACGTFKKPVSSIGSVGSLVSKNLRGLVVCKSDSVLPTRRSQSMRAKAYGSVLFSASNLNLFMGFCRKDIWIRTD